MNTGIGDAFNLGWKLGSVISGNASDGLLDTYEAERRPVAADVVRQTSRACLRVSYLGGPLAEMAIADRLSSFIRDAPLAGDRAPNAACRMVPSGEATTLGRLTDAHWALLLFGQSVADQRAWAAATRRYLDELRVIRVLPAGSAGTLADTNGVEAVVHDNDSAVARGYRPGRHAAILLRPDGHIALRSSRLAPEGLVAWLHRFLHADNAQQSGPGRQRCG
jgi:hypothetical protein